MLHASQSGTARGLAEQLSVALAGALPSPSSPSSTPSWQVSCVDAGSLPSDPEEWLLGLPKGCVLLVVASTYTGGVPPPRADWFFRWGRCRMCTVAHLAWGSQGMHCTTGSVSHLEWGARARCEVRACMHAAHAWWELYFIRRVTHGVCWWHLDVCEVCVGREQAALQSRLPVSSNTSREAMVPECIAHASLQPCPG